MSLERHPHHTGWIEVIAGGMFSGKTETLINRLRRAQIAKRKVQIFKSRIDNRYAEYHIVSHSRLQLEAQNTDCAEDILRLVDPDTEVVGVDEGHFFDFGLVKVCGQLADDGRRVIVAGLDLDYQGKPFEQMAHLLAVAEYITKVQAICIVCGAPANFSQRLVADESRLVVGAEGLYEARCRRCFVPHPIEKEVLAEATAR
ncbi:MAG: thymidine kinase [Blastocatellia bacterium]|nr:thymidine kinase [Blastocatellia bacterium]